jgi:hypothetical protein
MYKYGNVWSGRVGFAAKVYNLVGYIREIKFPASKETKPENTSLLFFCSPLTFDPITFGAQMGRRGK